MINYQSLRLSSVLLFDCEFHGNEDMRLHCWEQYEYYKKNPQITSPLLFYTEVPVQLRYIVIFVPPVIWLLAIYGARTGVSHLKRSKIKGKK